MRKKLNALRHLGILLLTVMIFIVGILIGSDVEELRVQNLYTQLQEQDLNYQNIVTESNYIDYLVNLKTKNNKSVTCDMIKGAYYTSIRNLDDSRLKLENYINMAKVKEEEYDRLKQHYANLQINYMVLSKKINSMCEGNMNPIIYFYGDKKDCPACEDQGIHLDYVKRKLKDDVLIFSLDAEKEGAIKLLAQQYEVKYRELPVIVIEEDIYGFMQNEEVFSKLCEYNNNTLEVCN